MTCEKMCHEEVQPLGLLAEETRGADQLFKSAPGQAAHDVRLESALTPEVGDSFFDIGPRRVLGQNGADCHLERGVGRPPVKRSVMIA